MQPNATDSTSQHVTPQQQHAIDLFARGNSIRYIAETVGVTRETLWRWRQNEVFIAALAAKKREHQSLLRDQTSELVRESVKVIMQALKKHDAHRIDDQLNISFRVLNFVGSNKLLPEYSEYDLVTAQMKRAMEGMEMTNPAGE